MALQEVGDHGRIDDETLHSSVSHLPPTSELVLESVLKLSGGPATDDFLEPLDRADVLLSGQFVQRGT